jgi:hypothetical protein
MLSPESQMMSATHEDPNLRAFDPRLLLPELAWFCQNQNLLALPELGCKP